MGAVHATAFRPSRVSRKCMGFQCFPKGSHRDPTATGRAPSRDNSSFFLADDGIACFTKDSEGFWETVRFLVPGRRRPLQESLRFPWFSDRKGFVVVFGRHLYICFKTRSLGMLYHPVQGKLSFSVYKLTTSEKHLFSLCFTASAPKSFVKPYDPGRAETDR